jgi:dTDP-4-amino-4,6-dideoxygalactose transaminase
VPPDTNLKKVKYSIGSCQKAEEISERILNLPTHINISREEAHKIVKFIKNNEY